MTPPAHSSRLIEAATFLKMHDPAVAKWPPEAFLPWFVWHWHNGGVGVIGEGPHIRAVGVARCVKSVKEAEDHPYAHHEEHDTGRILWVDQLASTHRLGLPLLLAQAKQRFGPRTTVQGHVFKRPGELRMLPWNRVEQLLKYHGFS